MSESEAQAFIGQRLRVLRIEKRVSDQAQLAPLLPDLLVGESNGGCHFALLGSPVHHDGTSQQERGKGQREQEIRRGLTVG